MRACDPVSVFRLGKLRGSLRDGMSVGCPIVVAVITTGAGIHLRRSLVCSIELRFLARRILLTEGSMATLVVKPC